MLIYSMSVSMDGFIADREGAFGWTWSTIASGSYASTALRTARASSKSSLTGFAPRLWSSSALDGELWVPVTSWPAWISCGLRRLPTGRSPRRRTHAWCRPFVSGPPPKTRTPEPV